MTTTQLLDILNQADDSSLDKILDEIPDLTFVDLIESFRLKKQMSKSELIQKATLDRTYAYQILNGTKSPKQDKVIQLSLALQLDLQNTNRLLTLTKNKSLYPKIKRDAVIIFCIHKQYSVIQTNELLYEHGLDILQ